MKVRTMCISSFIAYEISRLTDPPPLFFFGTDNNPLLKRTVSNLASHKDRITMVQIEDRISGWKARD